MSSRIRWKLFGLAVATLLGSSGAAYAEVLPSGGELTQSPLLFGTSFESGSLGEWTISGNAPVLTKERARAGSQAVKTYLNRYDSGTSYRTEIRLPGSTDVGKEYWYGFSVLLPSPYPADTLGETVAQWHSIPDAGEDSQNPVLAVHIVDGKWKILSRWNTTQPTIKSAQQDITIDLGKHQTDQWTDWVVRVKWSYGNDGVLQVWKDGVRVVDRTGPNCFRDEKGPYFKMGIYKTEWRPKNVNLVGTVTERLLYHDELRMAGAGASYDDVAPGRRGPKPVPPRLSLTPSN
jgi:Polysaccharide lyase